MPFRLFALSSLLVCLPVVAQAGPSFDEAFVDRTLRVDYTRTGNATEEVVALDALYQQGTWAGSRKHLVTELDHGRNLVKLVDPASGALLFSRTFDTIFNEYRTTTAAGKGVRRTFHESALVPFPSKPVRFVLETRGQDGRPAEIFSLVIDPTDPLIRKVALDRGVKVIEAHRSGDPHAMLDIAIVGEGYTAAEEAKFRKDLGRFTGILFSVEPFKRLRRRFNVHGVFKPSQESGCSEPSYGSHRNTAVGASFDSLGSERYVLTEENKALRDVAAHAPYDVLAIMVNHKRYGGGGIYNLYSTFTTDNKWHAYLWVHELGHALAGLADEYYSSSTAYNDFYPRGTEPREPNITALLDPANLKWKALVTRGTAVPTPWEKASYDAMDRPYQAQREAMNKKIAELKRGRAPLAEILRAEEASERLSTENAKDVEAFLARSQFGGQVGAFLGAGYSSEGLYRPELTCIMFNRGLRPFCKVCAQAIERVVASYGED
jgi:hypothetical protein